MEAKPFTNLSSMGSAEGLKYFETRDGISLEGATRVCYGEAPNANFDMIFDGEITVFFFFGIDGRLVKIYVRTWICSL